MQERIGVDTTFTIDFLNGDCGAIAIAKGVCSEALFITPISIFETFIGLAVKQRSPEERRIAEGFIDTLEFLGISKESAMHAAEMQASLIRTGKKAQVTDVLIAAAYLEIGCKKILTRDQNFAKLGLKVMNY